MPKPKTTDLDHIGLTIRRAPLAIHQAIKVRAAVNNRTIEEEALAILTCVLSREAAELSRPKDG